MSKYISNDKASLPHIPTVDVGVLMNCPCFYNTFLQVWYDDSTWLQGESVVLNCTNSHCSVSFTLWNDMICYSLGNKLLCVCRWYKLLKLLL